jgi:hypothetical protein
MSFIDKPVGEWKFDDLIDYCAGNILTALIKGQFRTGVALALQITLQWSKEKK